MSFKNSFSFIFFVTKKVYSYLTNSYICYKINKQQVRQSRKQSFKKETKYIKIIVFNIHIFSKTSLHPNGTTTNKLGYNSKSMIETIQYLFSTKKIDKNNLLQMK